MSYCTAVWNVRTVGVGIVLKCYGWTKHGHHLHGCTKHDGHDAKRHGDNVHQCRCGATSTEPLPPPVGPSRWAIRSEKDWTR